MKIIVCTHNEHKVQEFRDYAKHHNANVEFVSLGDLGYEIEPEETGRDFMENAKIKAQDVFAKYKTPVVSDDSGLCVDILGGAPGIYSKRYGSESGLILSDSERNVYLISQMNEKINELGEENRKAEFTCALYFKVDENEDYEILGVSKGKIISEFLGEHGFGYDPIFLNKKLGKTFGEMTLEEKNAESHRGIALKKLFEIIGNR